MKNNIKIGKFLNRALALRNVSQKEIADVLGVTPNTISYFCHDKRVPNAQQIMDIAEYLNVSTDYLFGRTEISSEISSDTENMRIACDVTGLSEKIIKLLHEYNEVENSGKPTQIMYDRESGKDTCIYLLKGFNKVIEENEKLAESFVDIIISLSSLYFESKHSAEYFIKKIESGEKIELLNDREHADNVMNLQIPRINKSELESKFHKIIESFYNPEFRKIFDLINIKLLENSNVVTINKNEPEFLKIKRKFAESE